MISATQPTTEVLTEHDLDVEPAIVLTNKTLLLLDAQFPDSEVNGMPDDALDGSATEQQ